MIVRPAQQADAEPIARIYSQGIEERIATFETEPRTTADMLAYLAEREGRYPVLVAEQDGDVVAWAAAGPYRSRECYSGVCEFSVYADRAARGTGAAQAALLGLIDACEEAGFWKLVSRIFPENGPQSGALPESRVPRGRRLLPARQARRGMARHGDRRTPSGRSGEPLRFGGGLAAAVAAGLAMGLIRTTLQVRSVPERVLEWMLLFVPLDIFEAALQTFGFSAKRYALYFGILVMLCLLTLLGTVALRRNWPVGMLLGIGFGLWLFTMLVVMPLTSAGFFALALLEGKRVTLLGYLGVALVYSAVLTLTRVFLLTRSYETDRVVRLIPGGALTLSPRRWALSLMGGSAAVLAGTYLVEGLFPHRTGLPTIVVADPQEPVPSGGVDLPNPHPNVAGSPVAVPSSSAPTPRATTTSSLPEPPDARTLARDRDGAVLASGRRPGELAEPITSNESFYVVTKNAGGDPILHPDDWRLVVDGEVQRPFELDYAALRKLPSIEITRTLECISNLVDKCELAPFGCDLISTARWRGVRLADVLGLVGGLKPGVTFLSTISADEYTTSIPIDVAMSPDTLLVFEMNGQVLPREHGYPARLLVPGRYGMKNAKWVVALRPMKREIVDWYGQRSWSREARVKTMTRIDVPARDAHLPAGAQRIAGVAYAGDRGIQKVEFSADSRQTWQTAELTEPAAGRDAWVRWQGSFTIAAGAEATLVARATDGSGALQPEPFGLAQPDGAAGWNTITVRGAGASARAGLVEALGGVWHAVNACRSSFFPLAEQATRARA